MLSKREKEQILYFLAQRFRFVGFANSNDISILRVQSPSFVLSWSGLKVLIGYETVITMKLTL